MRTKILWYVVGFFSVGMAHALLEKTKHTTPGAVEQEFTNIDKNKEGAWTWSMVSGRTPTAKDTTSRVWVYKNGSKLDMYLYDSVSTTWRGPVSFN